MCSEIVTEAAMKCLIKVNPRVMTNAGSNKSINLRTFMKATNPIRTYNITLECEH